MAWAAENGIVNGVGNNQFEPDSNITREQMAAILFRYAAKSGFDTSARGNLDQYPDRGDVSGYAVEPLSWAVAEGLIKGKKYCSVPTDAANNETLFHKLVVYC